VTGFFLTITSSAYFLADAPSIDILVDGVVSASFIESELEGSGTSTHTFFVEYAGAVPTSIVAQINDSSNEVGRYVNLDQVLINGRDIRNATLSDGEGQQTIFQLIDSLNLDLADTAWMFGQAAPDIALFGTPTYVGTEAGELYNGSKTLLDVIDAAGGNDVVNGNNADDIIYGGLGDDLLIGAAGVDVLVGGEGADELRGQLGDDIIYGEAGNDRIYGNEGNDTLNGGAGNDLINGFADNDIIFGESGVDKIYGGDGDDVIDGGADKDFIYGQDGNDTVMGGTGADVVYGGLGDDVLNGGEDNDRMYGEDGADTLNGDAGHDTLYGGLGNDTINGGDDKDLIHGDEGDDTLNGDAGVDTIYGGIGNDTINGGEQGDNLYGDEGDDTINGGDQNDTLNGGDGADVLHGDRGNDQVNGDEGDDEVHGDRGSDTLSGGDGNDTLYGGEDNDTLNGDLGNDILYGDGGNDILYGDNVSNSPIMEAGSVAVTQTSDAEWHSVSFSTSLQDAVVKMFAEDVGADPFTIRVRNVTDTGFEFQLDEFDYQDGVTGLESLSWVAVASGSHTLADGRVIEAGYTTATNESTSTVSFSQGMSSAVVFSQLSSDNDLSAVATRNNSITSSGFSIAMQEEEAADGVHATEDIGWIAIEAGGSVGSGMLTGTTSDSVTHGSSTVSFGGSFSNAVFLGDMQRLDGGDTSYVGGVSLTNSQAQVFIDEESSNDTEVSHTSEIVGYLALEEGIHSSSTFNAGSDVLYGGAGDDLLYADSAVDTSIIGPTAGSLLPSYVMADSPDAYWSLDDLAGTTADNEGSLGASVDGTVTGGVTFGAAALYTGASSSADFDGVNGGIRIPDNASINAATTTARTVELVFNADDVNSRQVLYEEGGATHGLTIYLDNGNVHVTGEHLGEWVDADISAAVSVGQTYHIAFVYSALDDSFSGYLDGTLIGSVSTNGAASFPSHTGDVGIGYAPDAVQFHDGDSNSGGYYFDGRISDVALYNVALSQSQLQDHVDAMSGPSVTADPIDDVLYGGDGFDQMFAGDGRDVFVFEAASAFNDVDEINGFDYGEQDAVDISDILTGYTDGVSDINDFVSLTTVGSDTVLSVDANGAVGGASFTDIVQINDFTGATVDMLFANHSIIPV
jgi:Ca2+-binding RTX toxin-like protein